MLWIGLTGGIATGKSTAARMLQEMGYPVVSADQVAREVVEPGQEGAKVLLHRFGPSFFDSNGKLNRPKLAAHIFSNSAARAEVESVLHPLIQRRVEQVQEEFKLRGEKVAFYDVPLLFEKKLEDRFDSTLLIYADESVQRQRLKERESWSPEQMEARLRAQVPIDQKLHRAHHVIDNSGTLEDLRAALQDYLKTLNV